VNTIKVKGFLGKQAELRYTQGGKPMVTFPLADSTGKGEKQRTTWWRCQVFGNDSHDFVESLKKGTLCEVTGRAEVRTYKRKDGGDGWSAEVWVNELKIEPRKTQDAQVTTNDDIAL
jgi:single-strand DNA-binding protein